ncbi:MAG: FMN-dependent NADH-azoreductase [Rubrivivax sp.]|nr:MAG: FMN-dependent NADH-azoreductase [Rubrivivax sp.]
MNILELHSSARVDGSHSSQLARTLVAGLRAAHPEAQLAVRDLAAHPHPALDEPALQALFTPAEQRSAEQNARVALDDALIAEIQAADVVVLGVPMYNFGVTTQLKNWIDAIARAKVTFTYTEQGPKGLLTGKKVYVVLARGGLYRDTPADTQVPYLRTVLAFLGMTDVEFIYAEGLAMGPDAERQGLASAQAQIEAALV